MRTISVTMSTSLDGVVQALGRADEDTRGGFRHGGWGNGYHDDVMAAEMAEGMSHSGSMLFGRRTWQDFITAWSGRNDGNPFTEHMNRVTKYVASTTLDSAGDWQNSVLLPGRAEDTVAELKAAPGDDLAIIGSASLVRGLHAAGLIDRYVLLIHPLTLGGGAKMFDDRSPMTEFSLTRSVTTTKGVIIAHYDRR